MSSKSRYVTSELTSDLVKADTIRNLLCYKTVSVDVEHIFNYEAAQIMVTDLSTTWYVLIDCSMFVLALLSMSLAHVLHSVDAPMCTITVGTNLSAAMYDTWTSNMANKKRKSFDLHVRRAHVQAAIWRQHSNQIPLHSVTYNMDGHWISRHKFCTQLMCDMHHWMYWMLTWSDDSHHMLLQISMNYCF